MGTVTKWSNVAVAMQSAIAAAKTISAITKAAPGVATSTAHGYSNGDYIYFEINGMYQLNGRVFRVVSVATDTFQFEQTSGGTGLDTTSFDTFTSGSAYKLTFGTSITTATEVSGGDATTDFLETTTVHVNQRTQIPGLPPPITYTMNHLWDIADAGQIAMKTASDSQAQRAFRFTFGTGGKVMAFSGFVSFSGSPGGSAQQPVTTGATITAFGPPTFYTA